MSKKIDKRGKGRRQADDSDAVEEDLVTADHIEEQQYKQTFAFYQANRGGVPIERYELPIVLDSCGYKLTDAVIDQINEHLETKGVVKLDGNAIITAIRWYKDQQMTTDFEGDVDEYLDAFVALGGDADKDGTIQKSTLIAIIKEEFELTIDMVEYLQKIGGDTEEIDYNEFCLLLDAGTSGNPSRVSSYLSQNKGSSFMRFSYFERNIDRLQF